MDKLNIDCILLAAGESTRMGRPKQTIPIFGKPIIHYCIETVLACCRRLIVVQGAVNLEEFLPIDTNNSDSRIDIVNNPNYRTGQLGSLQAGLESVITSHCFIMLADLIRVRSETFRRLASAIGTHNAAFPVCGDRRGHPVLINRKAMQLLESAMPNERAMKIIQPLNPLAVAVDDSGIFTDIDTEADIIQIIHK